MEIMEIVDICGDGFASRAFRFFAPYVLIKNNYIHNIIKYRNIISYINQYLLNVQILLTLYK